MMRRTPPLAAILLPILLTTVAHAQQGRVNGLKVLSDKVDDVTTTESLLRSFVKPGMTDQERAKAIFTAVVKYRHREEAPNEQFRHDLHAHDPIKMFNVYGYGDDCCAAALVEALNREDGREARGRTINDGGLAAIEARRRGGRVNREITFAKRGVAEVRYGDDWHMFDASLIAHFPRPGDGVIASVDEIAGSIATWYATHRTYWNQPLMLAELMRKDGGTAWKTSGPPLLANGPYDRGGLLPDRVHGWDATMVAFDRESEVAEFGYHVGHRALFSLRPGESFVREAGNRGLHVDMDTRGNWPALKARAPEGDLAYVDDFLPGYRGGIVGNGVHSYAPNLAAGDLALGAEVFDNVATGPGSPAIRVGDGGRPGVVVVPLISPYVYLAGKLRMKLAGRGGRVVVSLSTDNRRSFRPFFEADVDGPAEVSPNIPLTIRRRYAYWLQVRLTGGAGLDAFSVSSDFQHAPRTLPRLGKGKTTITVAAGADPTIATRSIVPCFTPGSSFNANETYESMGLTLENVEVAYGSLRWSDVGEGRVTVPIDVPGDLVALEFTAMVRARMPRDRARAVVSADGGRTWREVAVIRGPTEDTTGHFRVSDLPAGTRKALLRFELDGERTVLLHTLRVDADYRDPMAARSARPFQVVHRWTEGEAPRSHAETITRLPASYTIEAAGEPEMVSVACEMPASR
jgi:hypothetical protein